MWNKKISDMLSEFAEGVKNKTYKKIPYDIWRELRSHEEDFGTIEIEFAFANPFEEDRTRVFLKNQEGQELYTSYITDGAFGTYLFDLYQKRWHKEAIKTTCDNMKETIKASCDKMKESFSQLATTATTATANFTISSQELQDYCNTASGTGGIIQYGGTSTGWGTYNNGPATIEVNGDYFKVNGQTIEEMVEELVNKYSKEEEKEEMNLFKNFDFGSCESDNVRVSMYGVAVKNATGTWVSYDPATQSVIDVDVLNFDGKYLYKMPVAIKDIVPGDVVIHNRKPVFVVRVEDGKIVAADPAAGEEKAIMLTKSMFGFDFATKVVNLFADFTSGATADQPFGNMLPLMLMNDSKSDDMLPLLFMMNGGKMDMSNPMMLYFLMKDGKANDALPLMFLASGSGLAFGKNECHCNCDREG